MSNRAPMDVRRSDFGTGSHIEPPLDSRWSDLDQLAWQAGVVRADTGIVVHIREMTPGQFALTARTADGSIGISARDFVSLWSYLSAMSLGAELAQAWTKEAR